MRSDSVVVEWASRPIEPRRIHVGACGPVLVDEFTARMTDGDPSSEDRERRECPARATRRAGVLGEQPRRHDDQPEAGDGNPTFCRLLVTIDVAFCHDRLDDVLQQHDRPPDADGNPYPRNRPPCEKGQTRDRDRESDRQMNDSRTKGIGQDREVLARVVGA